MMIQYDILLYLFMGLLRISSQPMLRLGFKLPTISLKHKRSMSFFSVHPLLIKNTHPHTHTRPKVYYIYIYGTVSEFACLVA